nr:reverse transcriptase domain-containing protein [Tanacetum cinerariifolium]
AYENSLIYKEKTKRIHDSKIKDRVFNVSNRVLLFNSRLKIVLGKLKTHWSRPFTITQVFPYGTVELSQTDGPNFKEQPPDYSFPPRFDVYPDDFLEIESDNFDDDSFDSKGEKINEDFSRDDVLFSPDNEDKDFDTPFSELLVFNEVPNSVRLLPFSSENEEKVFKPGIYIFKKEFLDFKDSYSEFCPSIT